MRKFIKFVSIYYLILAHTDIHSMHPVGDLQQQRDTQQQIGLELQSEVPCLDEEQLMEILRQQDELQWQAAMHQQAELQPGGLQCLEELQQLAAM